MTQGKLILLRHGETTYNKLLLMCGQHDAPLTELGEEQARAAGPRLTAFDIDKVYSSSLSRAFNTASLALTEAGIGLGIEKRDDLMECHAGKFTGRSLSDPEIIAFPRSSHMAIPGGETEPQFVGRVRKFYEEEVLPRMAKGETVLVVSHAGVMHAFEAIMGSGPGAEKSIWDTKRRLPNTAIVVVDYVDGKMTGERGLDAGPAPVRMTPKGP